MIYTATTYHVRVSVRSVYQEQQSEPEKGEFIFAYRVNIENQGDTPIQLLRRYWHIVDSVGEFREIEGDGVVGEQPVLLPGDTHEYVSWCPLRSEFGRMSGHYVFLRLSDNTEFTVDIPEFTLGVDYLQN